jgi:NAD(P)-dependent dehydrogenase (short-subunit alcohol dehydrogenase family)
MGSISDNTSGHGYAYRASKTAVNMLMKNLAIELAPANIHILILHPGWVKTDMGGKDALIDAQTSVEGMRKMIDQHNKESGVFYAFDGRKLPW